MVEKPEKKRRYEKSNQGRQTVYDRSKSPPQSERKQAN
jgi:hypothetical protein